MSAQTLLFWRWPFLNLEWCRRRYGPRFTMRAAGFPPLVFLSDPEEVKTLLAAPADVLRPGEGGATIAPIVGAGSFMLLDEDEHLAGRRTVLPFFQSAAVQRHGAHIAAVVQRAVASWPRGVPFALHPHLRAMTLEIVLSTVFGQALDAADLRALHARLLAMLSVTASVVLPQPALRHGPGAGIWSRFLRARAEVDELIFSLIERGRRPGAQPGGMLATLLAERGPDGRLLSPTAVREHIMSIVLAGHETTTSELAWAFQLLAHHPRVQERLVAEIDAGAGAGEAAGSRAAGAEAAGVAGEEYLMATIHEVLRHRPVFLFTIPRAVSRPVEIGERTYAPPSHLLGCIYLLHHDPALHPEPHEFRPERFLDASPRGPLWLPWGGGRKRCPGRHMAMLEMKTVLRTVLSAVAVTPAARRMERPRWRSVIVTPHLGSRVILRNRRST